MLGPCKLESEVLVTEREFAKLASPIRNSFGVDFASIFQEGNRVLKATQSALNPSKKVVTVCQRRTVLRLIRKIGIKISVIGKSHLRRHLCFLMIAQQILDVSDS